MGSLSPTPRIRNSRNARKKLANAEVQRLQDLVSHLQAQLRGGDPDIPCGPVAKRPCRVAQGRVPVLSIPAELSAWLEERHADLHDALVNGDNGRILELTDLGTHDNVGGRCRAHGGVDRGHVSMRTCARYGLHASRVGEASHPGPPLTRLRRMGRLLNPVEVSSESESQGSGTRNQIVSPPWVDMRRGDEGEVSLRRRIMGDSETVPAESAVLREMDRHHVEETCVDHLEGPEYVMDEDVPGSTDTETVGGQSDVEGPVEQSWSEP